MLIQSVDRQKVQLPSPPRRLPLGVPNGWYAVGFSHELRRGTILARRLAGHDLAVYRTEAGEARAIDAYCPHLGAHFAYGGQVVNGCIQCPFHGFRFDKDGTCVATGYDHSKPPPTAKVRTWHLHEVNGVLLVYYDAQRQAPGWWVSELALEGWMPPRSGLWHLHSHPQEVAENSVDLGHLAWTHGYQAAEMVGELEVHGPELRARYTMRRPATLIGRSREGMRVEYDVRVFGLGYSQVTVQIPRYGIHSLLLVLPTPTSRDELELRGAVITESIAKPQQIHPLLFLVPRGLLNWIIARQAFKGFAHDIQQDFPMWEHKQYFPMGEHEQDVQRPALAKGDGPIPAYRRWARQFYPDHAQMP